MASSEKVCFVLMPFGDGSVPCEPRTELPWDDFFTLVLKQAFTGLTGYVCRRAAPKPGPILREILEGMSRTHVVIAILTSDLEKATETPGRYHPNPNVMYELGIAHALGQRETILLIDTIPASSGKSKIPFDIAGECVQPYHDWVDEGEKGTQVFTKTVAEFRYRLRNALENIEASPASRHVGSIQAALRALPSQEKLVILAAGRGDLMRVTAARAAKEAKISKEKALAKRVQDDLKKGLKPKYLLKLEDKVKGVTILDQEIRTFVEAGFSRRNIIVVGGFGASALNLFCSADPRIRYVHNRNWKDDEILGSLISVLEQLPGELDPGFVVAYADLLFDSREDLSRLYASEAPISFLVHKKAAALKQRFPETREEEHGWDREAEIVVVGKKKEEKKKALVRIGKAPRYSSTDHEEWGEFAGVVRFTRQGVSVLRAYLQGQEQNYRRCYLTAVLQAMIDSGDAGLLEQVDMEGGYLEVDTFFDLKEARKWWATNAAPTAT